MKKYKVTLAGCGSMARTWVEYTLSRNDVEIVAVVDTSEAAAKKLLREYALTCNVYGDVEKAIKSSNANLVFNVTSPDAHRDIVIPSLLLGCDVFGEKPMATSMKEALEMIAVAETTGKTYAVMQNRRYTKHIRDLKKLISTGRIGQVGFVCADFFLAPHFGGYREKMDNPLILDMSIHTFDQARFIIGADPVSVYCLEFNPSGSWYKDNAAAVSIFEFSDNSVFCYRASWCAQGYPTSWDASWRITGTRGTALWNGADEPSYEVVVLSKANKFLNDYKRFNAKPSWKGREQHFGCLDEMFSALAQERKAETDCSDNIKSMSMVFGAIKSAKEGRRIAIKKEGELM